MSAPQRVGLVGLGAMGRGVAKNLLAKGFAPIGYDIRPEARAWLASEGGGTVADPAALGRACDMVVSFVVDDAQTEAVLFGPDGLAGTLASGALFIACSTLSPGYVAALAPRLATRGIALLGAPVTGGAAGAAKGTLSIMVGGPATELERARPVLATFCANIFHLGEAPQAGPAMKVINQLLCGVHLAAAGEALALAGRQGVPPALALEVLASGSASSWMLRDRGPRMVAGAWDDVTSAVDIFVKDMGLVMDAARAARYAAPLATAAYNAFVTASGAGKGRWDDSAVMCGYADAPFAGEVPPPRRSET